MDSRFQGKYAKVVVSDGGKDVDGDSLVHVRFLWPSSHDDVALNHADARTLAHLLLRAVGDEEDPAQRVDARPHETSGEHSLRMGIPLADARQAKACEETANEMRPIERTVTTRTYDDLGNASHVETHTEDPRADARARMDAAFVRESITAEKLQGEAASIQTWHEISDVLSDDAFMDECAMRAAAANLGVYRLELLARKLREMSVAAQRTAAELARIAGEMRAATQKPPT